MNRESFLKLSMRMVGGVMLLAFPAILMPNEWMAASHQWLGLGEYPSSPLVEYLARSASLLYGLIGALFVLVAGDLRRYVPITDFLGVMFMVLGVVMVGVDLHAGMPLYWTLGEGPPAFAVGLLMVWLNRGVGRSGDG